MSRRRRMDSLGTQRRDEGDAGAWIDFYWCDCCGLLFATMEHKDVGFV